MSLDFYLFIFGSVGRKKQTWNSQDFATSPEERQQKDGGEDEGGDLGGVGVEAAGDHAGADEAAPQITCR